MPALSAARLGTYRWRLKLAAFATRVAIWRARLRLRLGRV